jgi:hypothetical protein
MRLRSGPGIHIAQTGSCAVVSRRFQPAGAEYVPPVPLLKDRWQQLAFRFGEADLIVSAIDFPELYNGTPLKWLKDGVWYYAKIHSIALEGDDWHITYAGPYMDDPEELWYDTMRLAWMQTILINPSNMSSETAKSFEYSYSVRKYSTTGRVTGWMVNTPIESRLVRISTTHGVPATITQPLIYILLNDERVHTTGIRMPDFAQNVVAIDLTDIDTDHYAAMPNDLLDVEIAEAAVWDSGESSHTMARALTVFLEFVII